MDIVYYIETDFDCTFLINGAFREKAGLISYKSSSPLYVTLFPLNAVLLPYTVKVVNGAVIGNENLADCYSLSETKYILRLKQRLNYVYSPVSVIHTAPVQGGAYDLFKTIKRGDIGGARTLLTKSLSGSIDDDSLTSFFSPYIDIIANRFPDVNANYLLVRSDKKCEAYNFTFSGGQIDNIEQLDDALQL